MNAASKAKWANILTALVSILALVQGGLLTNPPFSDRMVVVLGAVFTYVVMAATYFKQYLSPDVSSTGQTVTLWIAIIATITGLIDLLPIVNIPEDTAQWIKWAISVIVMIINIISKQLFPSEFQKDKMYELKRQ